MITISIDEIKRDLLGYLQRVKAGETILVLQADKSPVSCKNFAWVNNHPILLTGKPNRTQSAWRL